MAKMVFCFGSNLSGIHGAGAAKYALQHEGARWGTGFGHMGNSFALPTKDHDIKSLPLEEVQKNVDAFLDYARANPQLEFKVTRVGCGLAGFQDPQIALMFLSAPNNCYFDNQWAKYLGNQFNYWGTL